jgi:hypothetical protein
MDTMDDLTARITTKLDQRLARAATAVAANARKPSPGYDPGDWSYSDSGIFAEGPIILTREGDLEPELGEHITHWDPKAVLDLIAAHREILAWCQRANELLPGAGGLNVLRMLAKAHRIEVPE